MPYRCQCLWQQERGQQGKEQGRYFGGFEMTVSSCNVSLGFGMYMYKP